MDVLAKFTLANKKQTASAHAGVAQEPPALGRILIERKKSRGARAQRYFQVVFSRHSQAIAQWDVVNEPIETGIGWTAWETVLSCQIRSNGGLRADALGHFLKATAESRLFILISGLDVNECKVWAAKFATTRPSSSRMCGL
jgi:GH35 family endo-1,4-beta-xylanase